MEFAHILPMDAGKFLIFLSPHFSLFARARDRERKKNDADAVDCFSNT